MAYPVPTAPTGVDESEWASAVAEIRSRCGWHIAPVAEEDVLTLDGPGGTLLVLPTLRLVAVTSIVSDGVQAQDPEWSPAGMVRGGWSRKFGGITATITHGFEEWPAELTDVAKAMISAASRDGVSSVASGAHQVRYSSSLAAHHEAAIDRYRLGGQP